MPSWNKSKSTLKEQWIDSLFCSDLGRTSSSQVWLARKEDIVDMVESVDAANDVALMWQGINVQVN